MDRASIVKDDEPILVTGANGFVGSRVIAALLDHGFTRIRCFVRPTGDLSTLDKLVAARNGRVEIIRGNLLSHDACRQATAGAALILHLAAGTEKTYAGCVLNSVVTTRNLLDAAIEAGTVRRFLNVSSLAVYSNYRLPRRALLDETCELETHLVERAEPYVYAKSKQDALVKRYAAEHAVAYVIVRPGVVFGPGKRQITGRIGLDTFGIFLHLGGANLLPFTYVENCADAIALAGITAGLDGEVFTIVDDDLPTSRQFLARYKREVRSFPSVRIPYPIFFCLCCLWERYSAWSEGQLPPVFNRWRCAAYWKGNRYSNAKLKERTGWEPTVSMANALSHYFEHLKQAEGVS